MFDQFKKIDLLSIISSMKKKDISNMMDVYNKNNNQSIEQTIHKKNHNIHHKINNNSRKEQGQNIKKTTNNKKKEKQKSQFHLEKKQYELKDQKDMKKNIDKVVQKKKIKISKENLQKKIHTFVRAMNNNKIYDKV